MIEEFERHLRGTNLSENTISSYLFAIRQYNSQYDGITKKNLRAYKVWLIENYKPKTVNLRLRAIAFCGTQRPLVRWSSGRCAV